MSDQSVTGLPFVEGDKGLALAGAEDQIAPIAEALAAIGEGRTLIDGHT